MGIVGEVKIYFLEMFYFMFCCRLKSEDTGKGCSTPSEPTGEPSDMQEIGLVIRKG